MPKKAYRVEHPTSRFGPYHHYHFGEDYSPDYIDDHWRVLQSLVYTHADAMHPTLWDYLDSQQLKYTENHGALCGCPTLDALRDWFGPFLSRLVDIGFRVVEYDYEEAFQPTVTGYAQMIFVPIGDPREVAYA